MKIRHSIYLFCALFWMNGKAQQLPIYSLVAENISLFNPAYIGRTNTLDLSFNIRKQWTGVDNAPLTGSLQVIAPIKNKLYTFGGFISNDRNGQIAHTAANLNFAYRIPFASRITNQHNFDRTYINCLVFGINASYNHLKINGQNLRPDIANDPTVLQLGQGSATPDVDFGMAYIHSAFSVGISINQLLAINADFSNFNLATNFKRARHLYAYADAHFDLSRKWMMQPLAMARYSYNIPFQAEVQSKFVYNDQFNFGLGYRTTNYILFSLGYHINDHFKLRYAFDLPTSMISALGQTHELNISYSIIRKSTKNKASNSSSSAKSNTKTNPNKKTKAAKSKPTSNDPWEL